MRASSGHAARLAVLSLLLLAAAPSTAVAQDPLTPVPGAFCSLVTNEEVSAAFGIQLVLTGISGKSCTWSPPGSFGSDASLVPSLTSGTLEAQKEFWGGFPGGITDITVGGQPGLLRVNDDMWRSGRIFTEALGEVLSFQWDDYEGKAPEADVGAALTQLTEAALPRMSSITFAEPTPMPMPSFRTDPDLAARFPTEIAGQAVTTQTSMLADFAAFMGGETLEQFTSALEARGYTVDDLSIGFGSLADGNGSIQAFRLRGGDAAILIDLFLELAASQGTPTPEQGQVAGRDVYITRPEGGPASYAFAGGDVLWSITAEEPRLSEILAALP